MDVHIAEIGKKNTEIQRLLMVVKDKVQKGKKTEWEEWKIIQLKSAVWQMDQLLVERGLG